MFALDGIKMIANSMLRNPERAASKRKLGKIRGYNDSSIFVTYRIKGLGTMRRAKESSDNTLRRFRYEK